MTENPRCVRIEVYDENGMPRVSTNLPVMDDKIAIDDASLEARELLLNERMNRSPQGIAARVHYELTQRLLSEAPGLLKEIGAG